MAEIEVLLFLAMSSSRSSAMFRTALHVLQRPAAACAFVDDHAANVEAARRGHIA